jgi:hypothetical protein
MGDLADIANKSLRRKAYSVRTSGLIWNFIGFHTRKGAASNAQRAVLHQSVRTHAVR